jgi:hypothetical protein
MTGFRSSRRDAGGKAGGKVDGCEAGGMAGMLDCDGIASRSGCRVADVGQHILMLLCGCWPFRCRKEVRQHRDAGYMVSDDVADVDDIRGVAM